MLNKSQIASILSARFSGDPYTKMSQIPCPNALKDCYKAAHRIKDAIKNGEQIAIVGDYDADGVTSCAIISEFLDNLGADFIVKIPNRFKDGYGLNAQMIDELSSSPLILTVDNGICAHEAALECKKRGIDLIITDHHMPTESLPEAYAIVDPNRADCDFPSPEICGAQVAWYLVGALKEVCEIKNYDMGRFTDLLALAIIADMMELKGMNRLLVRSGLERINRSKRPCFEAIKRFYNKSSFEFDDISFLIAPLINSAGRMDDATVSFEFLRSKNIDDATTKLQTIMDFNNFRKEQERAIFELASSGAAVNDKIIVAAGEGWHEGVIGIVAGRLAKKFKRPAIVFSLNDGKAKGSARSVGRFDILSLIANNSNHLIGFGGHKGAAGIVIEPSKIDAFRRSINSSEVAQEISEYEGDILGEIDPRAIDVDFLGLLASFEPYGQKNPRPLFWLKNATIISSKIIGKDESHLKITLKTADEMSFEAIYFNYEMYPSAGLRADLLVSISKNSFRGIISPQLLVKEIAAR